MPNQLPAPSPSIPPGATSAIAAPAQDSRWRPARGFRLVALAGRREGLRVRRWLRLDSVAGALVLIAALAGFLLVNSPAQSWYEALRDARFGPEQLHLHLTVGQWASDGLLAIFFFIVGLELKRELVAGSLRSASVAIVPVVAAAAGVAVPAMIYVAVNVGEPTVRGWAIPTATDIAFAIAILGLIAPRIPPALRLFLLTLAVVDDFIAIAIIAVFYTSEVRLWALGGALVLVGCYGLLARRCARWFDRRKAAAWITLLPIGVVTWVLVHESGVHATIAGVLLAVAVPVAMPSRSPGSRASVRAYRLTETFGYRFGPLSAGVAVPIFAFFAAGVSVQSVGGAGEPLWQQRIALGIILGLVIGKPLGITVATLVLTRFTGASLGPGVTARELVGVGALAGVGFTVAMLIAELSFSDAHQANIARLAVMVASLIAVVVAALVLVPSSRRRVARQ